MMYFCAEKGENQWFVPDNLITTMNKVWLLVLVVFCHGIFSNGVTNISTRPDVVNVGAILSYKSIIGKVAKVAIEAAVEDVNSDSTVLAGTKIKLTCKTPITVDLWALLRVNSPLYVLFVCLLVFVHLSSSLLR
jgi:hypothetical protein